MDFSTQLGRTLLSKSLGPDEQVVTFDGEASEEPEEEDLLVEIAADVQKNEESHSA